MNGTIAFKVRGESPRGFIARITMPDGKLANMISFFKIINCIRTNNMTISQDSLKCSARFLQESHDTEGQ